MTAAYSHALQLPQQLRPDGSRQGGSLEAFLVLILFVEGKKRKTIVTFFYAPSRHHRRTSLATIWAAGSRVLRASLIRIHKRAPESGLAAQGTTRDARPLGPVASLRFTCAVPALWWKPS